MEEDYIQLVDQFYEAPSEELFQQIKQWYRISLFDKNNSNVGDKFRKVAQSYFVKAFTESLNSATETQDLVTISKIIKQPVSELQDYLNVFVEKLNRNESQERQVTTYPIDSIQNKIMRQTPDGKSIVYLLPVDVENLLNQLENKIHEIAYVEDPTNHQIVPQYFNLCMMYKSAFDQNKLLCKELLFNYPPFDILCCFDHANLETAEMHALRNKAEEQILADKDLSRFVVHTNIRCKKCGQLTVTQTEKQTRSADEATTQIFICSSCGYKWTIN